MAAEDEPQDRPDHRQEERDGDPHELHHTGVLAAQDRYECDHEDNERNDAENRAESAKDNFHIDNLAARGAVKAE